MGKADRWERFLRETIGDEEKIEELRRFFGVCLDPAERYPRAVLLVGVGCNGKSVLVEVLASLVGKEKVSRCEFDGSRFGLAGIVGARLNVSHELPSRDGAEVFKAVLSGDVIGIDRQHKNPVFLSPPCNLVFECNVSTIDRGEFFRIALGSPRPGAGRFLVVPFHKVFLGEDRDPYVLAELLVGELDAIRDWALVGLKHYQDMKALDARHADPAAGIGEELQAGGAQ